MIFLLLSTSEINREFFACIKPIKVKINIYLWILESSQTKCSLFFWILWCLISFVFMNFQVYLKKLFRLSCKQSDKTNKMIFGWKAIDKRPFASIYWRSGEEKNWTNSFIGVAIMRTEKQRNEKKNSKNGIQRATTWLETSKHRK